MKRSKSDSSIPVLELTLAGPLHRVISAAERASWLKKIDQWCHDFNKGDLGKLPIAIRVCGYLGEPLPPWIVVAWGQACNAVANRQVASWDEVLGNKAPNTPKRLRREQQNRQLLAKLIQLLPALSRIPIRRPLDEPDGLFSAIATVLEVTPRHAKSLYDDLPKKYQRSGKITKE